MEFRKSELLLIIFLAFSFGIIFFIQEVSAVEWYNSNWQRRKNITVDSSKVNGSHTDFSLLINITNDNDLKNDAQLDFDDILFTDEDGTTKFAHEIENYTVNGSLVAWVRLPNLNSTVNKTIYMYYNNSAAANQQNVTGVWNASYVGVWHLAQNSTGGLNAKDSTSNGNNGTISGTTLNISGQMDGAGNFDGVNDYINISDVNALDNISKMTVSGWVKPNSLSSLATIVSKFNNGTTTGWRMSLNESTGGEQKTIYSTSVNTTFTVPDGVTSITVKAWGAGGGGGAGADAIGTGGAGGGGGFAQATIDVTPGESLGIVVGGGGLGGNGANTQVGGDGGGGNSVTAAGGGTGGNEGDAEGGGGGGGSGYAAVKRGAIFLVQASGGGGGGGAGKLSNGHGGAGGAGGGTSGVAGSNAADAGGGGGGGAGTSSAGGAQGSGTGTGGSAGSANTGGNGQTKSANANGGGGAGGAGRFGGGGGGATNNEKGGGGGGGGSSLANGTANTTTAGSGTSAGNNTNSDYAGNAGQGGGGGGVGASGSDGNPGRIVLIYTTSGSNPDSVRIQFNSTNASTSSILATNTWGHWTMVFDGTQSGNANRTKFYFNGTEQSLTFSGTIPATTPNTAHILRIDGTIDDTGFFSGLIDEVRISNISHSAQWIQTEYNNQNSPSTFYSIGAEEIVPIPKWSSNVTSPTEPATYSKGQSYQFNITWTDNKGVSVVLIQQNFTTLNSTLVNQTMSNRSSEYYFNVSDLPAGTYVWKSFANNTLTIPTWNSTPQWTYTVNKASPSLQLKLNGTQGDRSYNEPEATNATGYIVTADVTTGTLLRDGVVVATGNPATEQIQLAVGTYNYTYNVSSSQNYTSGQIDRTVTVSVGPACLLKEVNITGISSFFYNGSLMNTGFVNATAVEKQQRGSTGTISNGQWSVKFDACTDNVEFITARISDNSNNIGFNELKIFSNNVSTSAITCTQQNVTLAGYGISLNTGSPMTGGKIRGSIHDTIYTNTTTFSNDRWEVKIDSCLNSGRIYTVSVLVSDNDDTIRGEYYTKYAAR